MTAITLNLLAEELQAEQARARDPVKMAIAIGAGLLTITVACGAAVNHLASVKRGEAAVLRAKWDEHESQLSGASSGVAAGKIQTETLLAIHRRRELCARQLALIKDL